MTTTYTQTPIPDLHTLVPLPDLNIIKQDNHLMAFYEALGFDDTLHSSIDPTKVVMNQNDCENLIKTLTDRFPKNERGSVIMLFLNQGPSHASDIKPGFVKLKEGWITPIQTPEIEDTNTVKIQIVNTSNNPLPKYETQGSSGLDLRANIEGPVKLNSLERKLIPTGLYISIPYGYEAQIRPRSGLALNHGLSLVNSVGTIDSDYRGEIGIILINLSNETYTIQPNERIAQMIFAPYERIKFELVNTLDETTRGECGFGHTGTN